MSRLLEIIKSLEKDMWEAAINRDDKKFLEIVSEEAVVICGGYRCLGKEYAGYVKEGIASDYKFLNFEIINEDEKTVQVHYVVRVAVNDNKMENCGGDFHVTSTWQKYKDSYKLIFNMDSKIIK